MKLWPMERVQSLARRALASGGTRAGASIVHWNIAGDCANPFTTVFVARPNRHIWEPTYVTINGRDNMSIQVEIETRCRNCDNCRDVRRNLWSHRAAAEARLWPRTWFGTITLNPESHFRFLALARRDFRGNGDYDQQPERERFRLLDRQIWREISKMLKRIRKGYDGRLRYYCVCEQHQSGIPHYHILIHQCDIAVPLKYTHIDGQWPFGFTKFRLLTSVREARYLSKYLAKSSLARVRASERYGETVEDHSDVRNVYALEEGGMTPKEVKQTGWCDSLAVADFAGLSPAYQSSHRCDDTDPETLLGLIYDGE